MRALKGRSSMAMRTFRSFPATSEAETHPKTICETRPSHCPEGTRRSGSLTIVTAPGLIAITHGCLCADRAEQVTLSRNFVSHSRASAPLWRLLLERFVLHQESQPRSSPDPLHCDAPLLREAEIAAVYSGERVAGDFYEFLRVGPSRMLFVLLDVAGTRAGTREILIEVQKTFRNRAPQLFFGDDFNETIAMIELCYEMNRTIMRGGLRSCPAFIGCYNEDLGTLCYANAGHTPGMLRDPAGMTLLGATGLPLGLFSHTTQSAAACHLVAGSALVVVSRGIIEAESGGEEFGLAGAKQSLQNAPLAGAHDLCVAVVEAARQFTATSPSHNDLTALALVRNASPEDF